MRVQQALALATKKEADMMVDAVITALEATLLNNLQTDGFTLKLGQPRPCVFEPSLDLTATFELALWLSLRLEQSPFVASRLTASLGSDIQIATRPSISGIFGMLAGTTGLGTSPPIEYV